MQFTITDNLQRILPPSTPPTPPPSAAAEIARITINPVDVAIAVDQFFAFIEKTSTRRQEKLTKSNQQIDTCNKERNINPAIPETR